MSRASSLNSDFTNFKVKAELRFPEENILSCFESSLSKVKFLFLLPLLCEKIISSDKIVLRMLGSNCVEMIYELFYLEKIWTGSNITKLPSYMNSRSRAFEFDDKMNVQSKDKSKSEHQTSNLSAFNASSEKSANCIRDITKKGSESDARSFMLEDKIIPQNPKVINVIDEAEALSQISFPPSQVAINQALQIGDAISPSYIEDLFQTSSKIGIGESNFITEFDTSSSGAQMRISDEIQTLLRLDDDSELQGEILPTSPLLHTVMNCSNDKFFEDHIVKDMKVAGEDDTTEESCTTSVYSGASNSTTIASEITLDTDIESKEISQSIPDAVEQHSFELNTQKYPEYKQEHGGHCHIYSRLILLFSKLLREIVNNQELLSWINWNIENKTNCKNLEGQHALQSFINCFTCFTRISTDRVESKFDTSKLQEYVEKEAFYSTKLQSLKDELHRLQQLSSDTANDSNFHLSAIKMELDDTKSMIKNKIRKIAREALINQHIQTKQQKLKLERTVQKLNELEIKAEKCTTSLKQFSEKLQFKRQTKEKELEKLIDTYDVEMNKSQNDLDILNQIEESNNQKIQHLKELFASTEEQYEEMVLTLKLKELLKNIQAQETFKQNRAARIIQNAWRKYRIRKFRKLRKRAAKSKRKPGIPGARKIGISDKVSESSHTSKVSLKPK